MTEADEIAAKVVQMMQPKIPLNVDLWDAATVAAYLKVSRRTVAERYATMDGFPAAIRLPSPTGIRPHLRWKAVEIIEWAEARREAS